MASSPKDYHACRELFAENHGANPSEPFSFPTVVAERDGQVIGFLATSLKHNRIMAGPLEVLGGRNPFTVIRLFDAYNTVMKLAGIQQFEFYVKTNRVDELNPQKLLEYEALGVKYNKTYMGHAFFIKEVA